ncbi:hypothetical protein VM98_30960 [Streptomyces rubellomurinus subsp. indigoferus]|nr:hypothetical protein VM98_30960 [Streptomyces rubellomurinus subsp. indigoferus]
MTAAAHGFQLRAPWYVCERGGFDRFDPRAAAPALQKYDAPDFVARLTADPRASLAFDPVEDVYAYPVPVPAGQARRGRLRFATHTMVATPLRKLYQPGHHRFYAVVVELFCDRPGLPRPGLPRPGAAAEGVQLRMVLRRQQRTVPTSERAAVRRLARALTTDLLAARGAAAGRLTDRDLPNVLWADLAYRARFEAEHGDLLAALGPPVEQSWTTGPKGPHWVPTGTVGADGRPEPEQELPMWRIPTPAWECERAATRSLWFGLVPTLSGEHDDQGAPKLDDQHVYELRCVARRPPAPGHEHCPPQESWSAGTEPFSLAAFYDPEGTKNHKVSITMPDLRALAARAGRPAGPGGVAVTTPPGSQLPVTGGDIPKPGSGTPGGTDFRICTFALELFMIVAFFLFSLFLPIVVLAFQLWWLLALRFCLPPDLVALGALQAYLNAPGHDLATLLTGPGPGNPGPGRLDDLLGAPGATAAMAARAPFKPSAPGADPEARAAAADLVAALDPTTGATGSPPPVESSPPDPLCGGR